MSASPLLDRGRASVWRPATLLAVATVAFGTISLARPVRDLTSNTRMSASVRGEVPTVRAAVNEHMRDIVRRSTYRFDLAGVVDMSSKIIDEPVIFEYAGAAGAAFRLAPAGFVALGQSGGYVYDITVALPDGARPLAEAYRTAADVDRELSTTAWHREGDPLPALDEIRRALAGPAGGATGGSTGNYEIERWRHGPAELTVALKRSATRGERTPIPGRSFDEDLYLVEVEIYDGSMRRAYIQRTYTIRRSRQRGNELDALPLTRILDDTTPVVGTPSSPRETP